MIDKNKLISKKMYGDISVVARMLDTTPANVRQLLEREGAKRHIEAVDALSKVIDARDRLLSSK
jgi:hypothetical protein